MKTFSHWRAVGRAMLDARRREGVTGPLTVLENTRNWNLVELTWAHEDGRSVEISWRKGEAAVWVDVRRKPQRGKPASMAGLVDNDNAVQILRVLAALDLVPADIAYAADERYGRCQKCDELAQWWPGEAEAEPRWVHTEPWRWLGSQAHNPVITEHKDAS